MQKQMSSGHLSERTRSDGRRICWFADVQMLF